ncbi:MAG TPA: TadE/TadG family type IV pilus assembly protein [Terriglobales bacterium]|nr:TadE/TadG family type IV pilus assembly protein [Terriglobales bacterium]
MLATIRRSATRLLLTLMESASGAAIVEFAVALPLLIVLVVGIFDFGGAFNLKQELSNAVREAARFGAGQPTNDLCTSCGAPPSVDAIRYLTDSYLRAAGINDCGLNGAAVPASGPPWIYTAAGNGCPGTLTLTISRDAAGGLPTPSCSLTLSNYGGITAYAACTKVSVLYPYQWHFNNVLQLISSGTSFLLSTIPANATVANLN